MFASLFVPLVQNFAVNCNAGGTFFGLVPWYHYLNFTDDGNGGCHMANFHLLGSNSDLLLIALAILDDLLRVAAMVAVAFVIWGGIEYTTSQGSPDSTNKARQSIINALVGLVIAIMAASLVSFIGGKLGG